jgi:hypothetical protein
MGGMQMGSPMGGQQMGGMQRGISGMGGQQRFQPNYGFQQGFQQGGFQRPNFGFQQGGFQRPGFGGQGFGFQQGGFGFQPNYGFQQSPNYGFQQGFGGWPQMFAPQMNQQLPQGPTDGTGGVRLPSPRDLAQDPMPYNMVGDADQPGFASNGGSQGWV